MDRESQFFLLSNQTAHVVYEQYQPLTSASLQFNGRVLTVAPASPQSNYGFVGFERGGVIKQYELTGIEINYPAEHRIEGNLADLEVKLIHQKVIPYESTVNQYRKIPDANTNLIIVLLFQINSKLSDNDFINQLIPTLQTSSSVAATTTNLDISAFNLVRDKKYFYYEGSFTSDPCNEVVNYLVVKDIYGISANNLATIQTLYQSIYTNSGKNNKPIASLYGRTVYRNYMNSTEASAGYIKHFLALSTFILFALLL